MTGSLRRAVGSAMVVVMLFNTACYAFAAPAPGVAPMLGTQVAVRLNATGTDELARLLGPRVEFAEGTLSEVRADGSVVVGVTSVRALDGIENFWSGQNVVTFAPRQVVEVQVRAIDRQKTRAATIGAIVGIVAIFALALGVGGSHGGSDAGSASPPP